MSIVPIDVGQEPNDETGDPLRDGGIKINANFAELDNRTAAAQAKADQGVADAAAAKAKADAAVPAAALGASVAQLVNGVVPASQLPSFVDDVLEFPARADFPAIGETGKIYIAINDGDSATNPTRQYRWSGAAYVLIPSSPGSTDQVPEGATNQYFTAARVRSTTLSGLGALVNSAILATDTLLQAFAKLQGQLNAKLGKNEVAIDSDKLGGQPASFYTSTMSGATAIADGTKGLVPAPPASAAVRVLSSLGTWIAQASGGAWGSITGTLSAQTDLQEALDSKLSSSLVNFAIIYPNGGTEASPANIARASRYQMANPFPNSKVICKPELLIGGKWVWPGWYTDYNGSSRSYFVSAEEYDNVIVIQTGNTALSTYSILCGAPNSQIADINTPTPCRVLVFKVKG